MNKAVIAIACAASAFLGASCSDSTASQLPADLADLPADTGGRLDSHSLASGTSFEYNHFVYLPSGALAGVGKYPLLVYLHGDGPTDDQPLVTVLYQGPQSLISQRKWHPVCPMIVVAPQNHGPSGSSWNIAKLQGFLRWVRKTYPVDTNRIYLTGVSQGGFGTYSYLTTARDTSLVAAAVPVMGGGSPTLAKYVTVPLWAFHGDSDKTVSPVRDAAMVDSIRARHPDLDVRITMFPGIGHETSGWLWVYDRPDTVRTNPAYDPYSQDIYSWMIRYRRK